MIIYNNNLFKNREELKIPLKNIKFIFLYRKGNSTTSSNSLFYRIGIRYDDECFSCMNSLSKKKVIMEIMKLRNFILYSVDAIEFEFIERDHMNNFI